MTSLFDYVIYGGVAPSLVRRYVKSRLSVEEQTRRLEGCCTSVGIRGRKRDGDREEDEADDNDADDGGVSTGRQLTQDAEGWAARTTGSRLPVATRPIAAVSAVRWRLIGLWTARPRLDAFAGDQEGDGSRHLLVPLVGQSQTAAAAT